ncbi:MAG TPA: CDP-glycerol glycerophosphotransferase family protein [Candidatus Cloacimonadota bacterium]|nr:CDP-glycerol glycerophosphotransferase family protein [Candidatus Cloacimonadota bacterium]
MRELLERKVHFAYYTLDIEDPLLKLNNEYFHSRFLGFGVIAKHRASNLTEPVILSTTPNIGTKGYPVKRSPKTTKLIHVFHSLVDLSMYRLGSLDHYDTVIVPGEYHADPIREIELKRGLKQKELIALGSPYLDPLLAEQRTIQSQHCSTNQPQHYSTVALHDRCILIGSSWGDKGLLKNYGIEPFIQLAKNDWQVIIRPHPHSMKHEPDLIRRLQKQSAGCANIEWDHSLSPIASMSKAKLLISDTSSLRFDFAFIYEKPVLTLEIPESVMSGFERDDMDEIWSDGAALEIGQAINRREAETNLESHVMKTLELFDARRIRQYRDANVANFGCAAQAITDYLVSKVIA